MLHIFLILHKLFFYLILYKIEVKLKKKIKLKNKFNGFLSEVN